MRQYIIDLTSHLIRKNRYDEIAGRMDSWDLIRHIALDLSVGDVSKMSDSKRGTIMSAFEVGDVPASKEQLFQWIVFAGDCKQMLIELVSCCLAYAIEARLMRREGVPPYGNQRPTTFAEGMSKIIRAGLPD